jgi:hypothetical protein
MDAGWTAMPNVIIEAQAALELDPLDMNILRPPGFSLVEAENKPHPAKASMAKAIGRAPDDDSTPRAQARTARPDQA